MIKNVKRVLFSIAPLLICSLTSCGETPLNDLQAIFKQMQNNNFTVDYYDSFTQHNNIERNEKYYFTDYSLQAEGDLGFSALGEKDGVVFRYNIVEGDIITSSPLINYNTGIRYDSIYEYTYGMEDFDVYSLPTEKDENGYYIYEHDVNKNNDRIFQAIFLKLSYNSLNPEEIKIKVVKDIVYIDAVILTYDFGEDGFFQDTVRAVVYDIGKTANNEIKQYLDSGKSYKPPLDMRFYKLIHPYLFSHNYTINFDASGMGSSFKMTEYSTDNAVLDVSSNGSNTGFIYEQGAVSQFILDGDKIKITGTPMADSNGSFYSSLFDGGMIYYTLSDLMYDNFIGYKDDQNDNVYYLTDSELIYILSYICYIEVYDESYCDVVKLEIIDDEKHEFRLTFQLYNKIANKQLGNYVATFSDLNCTSIPQVDRYKNIGDNPHNQSYDDLGAVLNKFKNGNYSLDSLTSAGMAKIYCTNDYFYEELYGNKTNNIGFINEDGGVYEFNIINNQVVVDKTNNLGVSNGMSIPGCGEFYAYGNDLGYLSHFDEALYNLDNYEVDTICGIDLWKINDLTLSNKLFKYIMGTSDNYLNIGTGLVVSNSDDSYDTRVTLIVAYLTKTGYEGYFSMTYYDINNTAYPLLESYIK